MSSRVDGDRSGGLGSVSGPRRPLWKTMRRRRMLLLGVFCALFSGFLLGAPLLQRTYDLGATFQVRVQAFEAMPELNGLAESALRETERGTVSAGIHGSLTEAGPGAARTVRLSTASPARDRGIARLHVFAGQFGIVVQHRAEDITNRYRSGLQKSADRLADREQGVSRDVDAFQLSHRGALPDDPTSVLAQFEKLSTRLEEKQQRMQVVSQQSARLQEYKKASQANGGRGAIPPPPLPPAEAATKSGTAVRPEADPEVVTLTAQLQLLSEQIEEQLTTMGRKDQHPYVVELRNQQAGLQKKLEAARLRAAAGKPPPPAGRASQGGARTSDSGQVMVDTELEKMQAEHDALGAEVRILSAQRDSMQKRVDQVLPIRQEYEKLTGQLAGLQKERQIVRMRMEEYDRQVGASTTQDKAAIVDVSPLALSSTSTLPSFPQVPLVYGVGLVMAVALAGIAALLLNRLDRALHSPQDVAAALEVPVLGTVGEIRTPGQQRRRRLWRVAGQPAVLLGLLGLVGFSALVCYWHLADPLFSKSVEQRGMTAVFFAARTSE